MLLGSFTKLDLTATLHRLTTLQGYLRQQGHQSHFRISWPSNSSKLDFKFFLVPGTHNNISPLLPRVSALCLAHNYLEHATLATLPFLRKSRLIHACQLGRS
jgi:hypothetical protein